MYDKKVFTNDKSYQLIGNKRPNVPVENLLLSKGKQKELKIKKLEQEMYGRERVPNITRKAHSMHRNQDVHSR